MIVQPIAFWGQGSSDPLAGLSLLWRISPKSATDLTPNYLFQDDACTVPWTAGGQGVAGTQFPGRSIEFAQSNSMQVMTGHLTNGIVAVRGDGISQWLPKSGADMGGQVTYSVLVKSNTATWNGNFGFIENSNGASGGDTWWGLVNSGNTDFYAGKLPADVSKNGVDLPSPYDCGVINQWMVLTITTENATVSTRGIGQLAQAVFGNWDFAAHIGHDPADTATVVAFLNQLKALLP